MYKRILVPVDGSATSNKALTAALQMARTVGGRVRLFHAMDELAFLTGSDQYTRTPDMIGLMREAGTKVLTDAQAIAESAGVEVDQVFLDQPGGRLGETVAHAARLWNADLIVVGTHGRHGVGRMLLGSGAEQIIRLAPVHVLVVRDPHPA